MIEPDRTDGHHDCRNEPAQSRLNGEGKPPRCGRAGGPGGNCQMDLLKDWFAVYRSTCSSPI